MDKSEVKEVASEIAGIEAFKIWWTIKYLTISPGLLISEYCRGERKKYISPVAYYFGMLSISYFLMANAGMKLDLSGVKQLFESIGLLLSKEQVEKFVSLFSNETLSSIFSIPFALILTWLLFKKYNPSFKQNSWFTLFIAAQTSLFSILKPICFWSFMKATGSVSYGYVILATFIDLITFGYSVWASSQFYKISIPRSFILNLVLTLLIIPVSTVMIAVVVLFVIYF